LNRFPAVLVFFLVLSISPAIVAAPDPVDIVGQKYKTIKGLVVDHKTRDSLEDAIRKEMETFVDYQELGRLTISDEWDKLKKPERKRFIDGFKKMVQRSYVRKFNPDTPFEVEIGSSTEKEGRITVSSVIRSGKSEAEVSYAFHKSADRWMVHDVIIDKVSMVKNYRKQFTSIIGKEGFNGLMARIEKKNAARAD